MVLSPENPTIDPGKCADIAWRLYQHKNGLGEEAALKKEPNLATGLSRGEFQLLLQQAPGEATALLADVE
jgi:hypothetical protein